MVDSMATATHFPCFAHSLNPIVKNRIKNSLDNKIIPTIQKGKDLVHFFHQSSKATRFKKKMKIDDAEEGELVPGTLVQYVSNTYFFSSELV